jgi:hypothetical protein
MNCTDSEYEQSNTDSECELNSTDSDYDSAGGSCEHGYKSLVSTKDGGLVGQMSDYQFPNSDSAPFRYYMKKSTILSVV